MRNWLWASVWGVAGAVSAGVDFETEVLPILEARCFKCHGHGEAKGKLSLEAKDIARSIGSGKVIRPGEPEKSRLIKLLHEDGEDRMPAKGGPLAKASIETLTQWVKEGASLQKGGAVVVKPDGKKPLAGIWTNTDGKEIEAELVQVEGGKAILRLKSGKLYRYPLDKLSAESRRKVEQWARAEEEALP